MSLKFYTFIFIIITALSFSQNTQPDYFDQDWKKTSKEKAFYYRIMPLKKIGKLNLIQDFYLNKTPQFQGYSLQNDENSYVGDIVWYDENGFDSSAYQFYNFSVPVLTYYYPNGKKYKTIEYKEGKRDGMTILYHQDGTILMKGKYSKGQPLEGDFEDVVNWDNYRQNESEREGVVEVSDEPVVVSEPQIVTIDSPVEVSNVPKKQIVKKIIKKKIFWINSKQLAQETWYEVGNYTPQPIKQVNYDQAGKMLQTIEEKDFQKYGSDISNGTVYEYYVQNKFAVTVKSKTEYKERQKAGEEIKYHPNGKTSELTKYNNGEKVGDEIVYNENEVIIQKRTYKNGEPFEGNFNESFTGNLVINQNYLKGIKEGEAIAKTDKDSIVAKGIYKDGRPYNGTFIDKKEGDYYELINVVDFKKNGVQKIFNYHLDNIIKTYTSLNDVLNGETVFYEDKIIIAKLEYKNDLPYEGKLVSSETATIYSKGEITQEIFYKSKYDRTEESDILKSKYFTNGKLTKIVDHSFSIADNVQDNYEGIYKNEKPFSGYFSADLREFNYVDYYENGIKKYQYSNNYLENLDNYQHPNYNIKSIYKNGKIVDGVEYIKLNRQFISKYWKNAMLQSFDFDIFAVHYFNRFHFELKNNSIEITDLNKQKKGKIVSEKVGNKVTYKLIIEDEVVVSESSLELNNIPEESGTIVYYESENTIEAKFVDSKVVNNEKRQESEMLYGIFTSNINTSKTISENFKTIVDNFSKEKNAEGKFGKGDIDTYITGLRFNQSKKPEIGILILKNKNNSYDLKSFLNGKILEERKSIDIKKIRKEVEILNLIVQKKMNNDFN